MSYALVVSRVAMIDRTTELHVLAVTTGLALEDAMHLLGRRPPGTVAHLRRLPADLPAVGEVLRLDPREQAFNAPASQRGRPRTRAGGQP
jgi:hypothetical protein